MRVRQLWCNHSKTIVSLAAGTLITGAARFSWPDGGVNFDLATLIGGILLAFGMQGLIDCHFREISKPED